MTAFREEKVQEGPQLAGLGGSGQVAAQQGLCTREPLLGGTPVGVRAGTLPKNF